MATKGEGEEAGVECTMCGDHGLPDHLFQCTVCTFRSQHRYCSDLYPKAETYRVCNWCLREKEGHYISSHACDYTNNNCNSRNSCIGIKRPLVQSGNLKQKLHAVVRKESLGVTEELLRQIKKPDVYSNNSGLSRQIFRGKVGRYRYLEEDSS